MGNPKITLAIFGNQNSNSGFQPLYWINNPPQQLENLVPPGMEENTHFFVLEATPAYTQFTLIQNHVSSYMSVRAGVLKIAITIPAGYQVAGGVSPMQVLQQVKETFMSECMTRKSSLSETYNFNEKLVDGHIFSQIVDNYTLEPAAYTPTHPMRGNADGIMLLPATQIAELFKQPQHPEFESCRKVVVAEKGNTANYHKVITSLQPLRIEPRSTQAPRTSPATTAPRPAPRAVKPKKSGFNIIDLIKIIGFPLVAFCIGIQSMFYLSYMLNGDEEQEQTNSPQRQYAYQPLDSITIIALEKIRNSHNQQRDTVLIQAKGDVQKTDSIQVQKSDTLNKNKKQV